MRRNFCNIFLFLILIFTSINAQIFYDKYSAAKRYERAFNKNSKYSNIYLIEWNRQDDRKNRQGMYFLLSGSYTGIFNQLIQTGSSWFTKYMDDLGTEHSYYEESDREARENLKKLKETSENFYPFYSYKATVNNNNDVYFVIAEYEWFGITKWHIVMVTNRYDFKFSEEEGIEAELIAGRAKVFEFNVILAKKMEVFDEYIKSQKNN